MKIKRIRRIALRVENYREMFEFNLIITKSLTINIPILIVILAIEIKEYVYIMIIEKIKSIGYITPLYS